MDKQRVIEQFQRRVSGFLSDSDEWRRESERMRDIYNGYPANGDNSENYTWKKLNPSNRDTLKRTTVEPVKISLAPAYCRAVCGSLLRDRKRVAAINMSNTTSLSREADVMDDMFQALEEMTQVDSVKYRMVTEAAITGVGASVFYLDMTVKQAPFGVPMEEEKQYVFFDKGRNGKLDSDEIAWCGYADPVYKQDLDEYVERNNELDIPASSDFSAQLLEYVDADDQGDIDFIYHYFWREWTQIYDVRNAFRDNRQFFEQLASQEPLIDEVIIDVVKRLNLHIDEEYFSFDKEEYSQFKEMLENVEYIGRELGDDSFVMPEFAVSKREGRMYYRAEFAGGRLLKAGRSFTSQCHPMNFVTAFWDSRAGHHYGLMRHLSFPQKELEKSLTSMQSYSERSARGGNKGLRGAGDKTKIIKEFIETGAETIPLGDTEIVPYGSPDAAQAHMQAVQMFLQLMPKTLGVSDAIFAEVMSGNMTSALFKQLKEQISLANAEFSFAIDRSDLIRGYIYRDITFDMATMVEGDGAIPIKYYVGDRENLVMLSRKSLARYYGVRLVQRPASMDEKKEMAQMLLDVFPDQLKGAITPIIFDLLPLDQQVKDTAAQAMQPPPPDPMQQQIQMEQIQAQIRLTNAQAAQLENTAQRELAGMSEDMAQAELDNRKAAVEIDKGIATIYKDIAQTAKIEADTAAVIANVGLNAYDKFVNRNEVMI